MKTIQNYSEAVNYFGNSFVLCNKAVEIEPYWFESLWGDWFREGEDNEMPEIYQYFVSNCSEREVRDLCDWFGLLFFYSEALDCFVLCVDHFGTAWRYVPVEDNRPAEYR